MGLQVGLFFVLFDIEAIGLAIDAPVEVPQIVAGHIFTMLGEFDRIAAIRAAVHATDQALDGVASAEFQIADLGEYIRAKILPAGDWHKVCIDRSPDPLVRESFLSLVRESLLAPIPTGILSRDSFVLIRSAR